MPKALALLPREHGAYAMLAFPVVSGLMMGGVSWAGMAFAVMAVAGFLAHESVLVVTGARGARIHATQAGQARRGLMVLGALILCAAVVFTLAAPTAAWRPTLVTAALAASVTVLLLARKTKSLPGELLVASAFAAVHGVLAASGGADPVVAWAPAGVWAMSFALATLAVHALKYRFKGKGPGRWAVAVTPVLTTLVTLSALAALGPWRPLGLTPLALFPKAVVVLALSALPANPRHLKRVGWSFVAADAATLLLLPWVVGLPTP